MKIAKLPQQKRGIDRVARILDAASQEILVCGVDGLTMDRVAKRATTAAGSLYQFFPTRAALLIALAQKYEHELAALATQLKADLEGQAATTIEATALRFLEPFIQWYSTHPAYITLLEAMPRILLPEDFADAQVALHLADCLRPYANEQEQPRLKIATQLLVSIGHTAIASMPMNDKRAQHKWFNEVRTVLSAYAKTLAM